MNLFGKLFGRAKPKRPHPQPMVSLVALFNSFEKLTCDVIRERLDGAFPGWFLPPREQGTFVVDGEPAGFQFLINSAIPGRMGIFLMLNVPEPYTAVSGFAELIEDEAMRARATAQQSWLSIDLIGRDSDSDDDAAYRFIGAALAALAPDDTAFLVHADTLQTVAFDDEVRRRLASDGSRFGVA